ncbi:MAG: hypothetical protein K0R00_2780 [Herbinix sp.]|jgi:hypothetical protein|nr:hypothetical protein [Herbinix sp.]
MKSNKDHFNFLYNSSDLPNSVAGRIVINEVLKTFSAYITNYDNDYLYNYKFITSHIDDFIKTWDKSSRIIFLCERLKDILMANDNIKNFCKSINQNMNMKLSILINEAIEIHNSTNIDILNINREKYLSNKSILYNENEIDLQIRLIFNTIEIRKDFNKVIIRELINNDTTDYYPSIVSIINDLIKDFFYYIIEINNLSSFVDALQLIDYTQKPAKSLYIQFGNFLEYYPFKEKENLNNAYVFKFDDDTINDNFKIESIHAFYLNKILNYVEFSINQDLNYINQLQKIIEEV